MSESTGECVFVYFVRRIVYYVDILPFHFTIRNIYYRTLVQQHVTISNIYVWICLTSWCHVMLHNEHYCLSNILHTIFMHVMWKTGFCYCVLCHSILILKDFSFTFLIFYFRFAQFFFFWKDSRAIFLADGIDYCCKFDI